MDKLFILLLFMIFIPDSFKKEQIKYVRVKTAYSEKQQYLEELLASKHLHFASLEIYIQVFKHDGILRVWAKNKNEKQFQLLTAYKICSASGVLGPKRKEGDLQVPEGFYSINHFNPESNFYLSLGINYPNKSDKVFADKTHPGGSIYIHGQCVTIGCMPITDDKIKELYILTLEARNNGQHQIPVTIFPTEMSNEKITEIKKQGDYSQITLNLWEDLKKGYDYFEKNKVPPFIEFLANGRHQIK